MFLALFAWRGGGGLRIGRAVGSRDNEGHGVKPGRWSRRLVTGENALFAARALELAKDRGAIQPKPLAHCIEFNLMARQHDRWQARHKLVGGLLADAPQT